MASVPGTGAAVVSERLCWMCEYPQGCAQRRSDNRVTSAWAECRRVD